MKIGFVGAGKVGCSLGRFFTDHGLDVVGYCDKEQSTAREAAVFTGSEEIAALKELVESSDTLFLTVPDGLISQVWDQVKAMPLVGKYVCHCSGALSAGEAFAGIESSGAFGYSIHPLFAVSDRFHSYKELSHAFFTIEGDERHLEDVADWFRALGNPVRFIKARDKVRYHLAAALCSNHVVAVIEESLRRMRECGFDEESAIKALTPLIRGNVEHILSDGVTASLTGPVERADVATVRKHMSVLSGEDREIYRLLSKVLVQIGQKKNPERAYDKLLALLEE